MAILATGWFGQGSIHYNDQLAELHPANHIITYKWIDNFGFNIYSHVESILLL